MKRGLHQPGDTAAPLLCQLNLFSPSVVSWPKLKKNILPERLANAFQQHRQDSTTALNNASTASSVSGGSSGACDEKKAQSQDFVFRLIFTMSSRNIGMKIVYN